MSRRTLLRALWNGRRTVKNGLLSRELLYITVAGCLLFTSMQVLVTVREVQVSLQARGIVQQRDFMQPLPPQSNVFLAALTLKDGQKNNRLADVVARIPNLPLHYGLVNASKPVGGAVKCAKYPSLVDMSFSNTYWQVLHTTNGTFYLYSAYFDDRLASLERPSIRILAMVNRVTPAVATHCQLWYEGQREPVVTAVTKFSYIWYRAFGNFRNGILQPYLLQCIVPDDHSHQIPQSVSLVEGKCDKPKNNLRINYNAAADGTKENFAVCVKGLSGTEDNSHRIVEWLELLFLLGANKVFLYEMGVHPNMLKVFRHYEYQGKVDVRTLTLPGDQPNDRDLLHLYFKARMTHKRQNEVIPYNDCLYRSINRYKFIVLLDTDEVIMPRTTPDWETLMRQVAPETMAGQDHPKSSYVARHVYFLDPMQEGHGRAADVPPFMHMLQHVYRAFNYTKPGSFVKCFHDPQRVLTLHNHFPISCIGGGCSAENIPIELAHLQHYRITCKGELRKTCPLFLNHTVLDDSILRFKEPLVRNTLNTLRHLGLTVESPQTEESPRPGSGVTSE